MKKSKVKLSILMPVRNESPTIKLILKILEAVVEIPHEVLIVYDFPEDTTVPIVKKVQPQYPNVRLVYNNLGRGVANAIRAGVKEAESEYVLLFTADEILPVLVFEDMVKLMDAGCDFVSCTRYEYGGKRYGGSLLQFIFSRAGNKAFKILSGSVLTDCTTGFKIFRKSIFDKINIESKAVSWSVVFELAVKAQTAGLRLGEVPVISVDRLYGGQSAFSLEKWLREYFRWFVWGVKKLRSSKDIRRDVLRPEHIKK